MIDRQHVRAILAKHLGAELTPERAALIEGELADSNVPAVQGSTFVLAHRDPIFIADKPTMEQILRLEAELMKLPPADTPTTHHFAPGIYARQMFIPKDTILTGAVHKTEHLAMFVGDITVWTDGGMKRLTGHHTIASKAGAKRVGYAHEDTWCTCFFPTDKTDIAELEAELCESPHLLQCNRTPAILELEG